MVDEYGLSTCNCLDSAMGYSKENQTCLCPHGLIYTEDEVFTSIFNTFLINEIFVKKNGFILSFC